MEGLEQWELIVMPRRHLVLISTFFGWLELKCVVGVVGYSCIMYEIKLLTLD
ncbi:hypothetical protein LOK49_LG04G00375 [Camellia lanceoleosa]|uniref:Uncharacterized protein n=1 Tax=Camellia lanceoleosa TaxID=1840588 RepID=A0ACC0I5D3_9ERIC|nr:hypothetical protein LOK49_LG04G00375 [Camellia lanceoleosa]